MKIISNTYNRYIVCHYNQNFGKKINHNDTFDMSIVHNKPDGIDEKIFPKPEIDILTLSDVSENGIVWKGTSIQPHKLYRGISSFIIKKNSSPDQIERALFVDKLSKLKKGDEFCFNEHNPYTKETFTSYDPVEAAVYADFENFCGDLLEKRVLCEIDMPRNSHMYLEPDGYRSQVSLPINNLYELTENPKMIKQKVITRAGYPTDVEFLSVKLKLKNENLK